MICPRCALEYEEFETVCHRCGSPLLNPSPEDGSDASKAQETRIIRVCPICCLHYEIGNYCRRCGSFLEQKEISQIRGKIPGKKLLRNLFSERVKLKKKMRELEICLKHLEEKQSVISEGLFIPVLQRYQAQMEALSCRVREIESEFDTIKTRASKEIESLEDELKPIQERLEEICSLQRLGVIPRADYTAEKNKIAGEMNERKRRLKEYRKTISTLAESPGGGAISLLMAGSPLRNRRVAIVAGMVILFVVGTFFLWPEIFSPPSQNPIPGPQTIPSNPTRPTSAAAKVLESEKIRQLFDMIRQANLRKEIDLFMSCYTKDLEDRSGRRATTLETWNHFDYLDLSYELKRETITGHGVQVRVEWWAKVSRKSEGLPQERKSIYDVTLRKEDGFWKISEIKPVS